MLDLHCHMLPAIDDGAIDLNMALEMARIAVADGITLVACTPHIYPGVYDNDGRGIRDAIQAFRVELKERGIGLELVEGADVHLAPNLLEGVRTGRLPTLAGSRYLLLEPPHHAAPPRFEDVVFELMAAGVVTVITHPERLSWIESHYDTFVRLAARGAWLQVTAGALTGRYGRRAKYWGERLVGEGLCMILASDAHDPRRRPPLLAEARDTAVALVGSDEATLMVSARPNGVVLNQSPEQMPAALSWRATVAHTELVRSVPRAQGLLSRLGSSLRRR